MARDVTLTEGVRGDGRPYNYFETFDVRVDRKRVGMSQCVGPCMGIGRAPGHTHGPWIAFVGDNGETSKNLPGRHDDKEAGVNAILAAIDGDE